MHIGILCSAGGSAFREVAQACPHVEFSVITDRVCGAEEVCRGHGIWHQRIVEPDRAVFSRLATDAFARRGGPDFVLMFFSRLVTEPLLSRFPLLNIHPALLPAFPGMGAVRQAARSGVRFFGATLHVADVGMDSGPIIGQAVQPIRSGDGPDRLEKLSFLHKVCLSLVAIDLVETGRLRIVNGCPHVDPETPMADRLNPALDSAAYLDYVRALQEREGAVFL